MIENKSTYRLHTFYAPFTLQAVHPTVEVLLASGTASRWPHFVHIDHITGRPPLIGHSFLTVNNSRMTVLQMLVTKKEPLLTSTYLQ